MCMCMTLHSVRTLDRFYETTVFVSRSIEHRSRIRLALGETLRSPSISRFERETIASRSNENNARHVTPWPFLFDDFSLSLSFSVSRSAWLLGLAILFLSRDLARLALSLSLSLSLFPSLGIQRGAHRERVIAARIEVNNILI